jgi:hypothetical protein
VSGVWVKRVKEGIPLVLHDAHHSGVASRCVLRPEWHHLKGVLLAVRAEKGELVTVDKTDSNLVVALASIKTDESKTAEPITKIVDGIIAARNRIFEREGDCIQLAVGDAQTPDEVLDIGDVVLA